MRRLLVLMLLAAASGCDRYSSDNNGDAADRPPVEPAGEQISTTQGTLTVKDPDLTARFPLTPMAGSKVFASKIEQPGQPVTLQMAIEVQAPLMKVADYYETAMKAKGLKVQTSLSRKDPNQINLFGESPAASVTVMLNRDVGGLTTSGAVTWTDNLLITPGAATAPEKPGETADERR